MGLNNKKTNEPADGWRQADFKSIICIPTYRCYLVLLSFVCFVSFILTIIILALSYQVVEAYSEEFSIKHNSEPSTVNVKIKHDMSGPVYVYLIINDFYQNHRIYLKSKSKNQLAGKSDSAMSTNCSPFYYSDDYPINNITSSTILNPCGLLPNSFINLNLSYKKTNGNFNPLSESGISWKQDDSSKYVQTAANFDVTNEKFKNWMRTSATKTVQKLYGVIGEDLEKNESLSLNYILVNNGSIYFNYTPKAYFLLSTVTRIGGRNLVLGYYFLVITILSLIWIIVFLYLECSNSRKKKNS